MRGTTLATVRPYSLPSKVEAAGEGNAPDGCSICLAEQQSKSTGLFTCVWRIEARQAPERLQDFPLVL